MTVPQVDLVGLHEPLKAKLHEAFEDIISTGGFLLGKYVTELEEKLASHCGTRHALAVASGSDALIISLMALGIGPGDEVITAPFTFFATAGGISRVGAKPVFVDIDPDSFNIDPAKIEAAITDNTAAIMPVHLYGQPAAMDAINEIASRHNLAVIEDAAQAIDAAIGKRQIGSLGTVGCFSFYPTKNLSGLGDGGAVTTDDDALFEKLKSLRVHGQTGVYEHQYIGGNFRLDAIQGAALSLKFNLLEDYTNARREIACRYHKELAETPLKLPVAPDEVRHVFNQYTVRVPDGQRDALLKHCADWDIAARVFYPKPLHLQPCYQDLGYKSGDFPESEKACTEVLCLPIFPGLTEAQQQEVVTAIREFFG